MLQLAIIAQAIAIVAFVNWLATRPPAATTAATTVTAAVATEGIAPGQLYDFYIPTGGGEAAHYHQCRIIAVKDGFVQYERIQYGPVATDIFSDTIKMFKGYTTLVPSPPANPFDAPKGTNGSIELSLPPSPKPIVPSASPLETPPPLEPPAPLNKLAINP